jgi:hypothetical protein
MVCPIRRAASHASELKTSIVMGHLIFLLGETVTWSISGTAEKLYSYERMAVADLLIAPTLFARN